MARTPNRPRLRRKPVLALAGATLLASASLAIAQVGGAPDGSPAGEAPPPNLVTTTCGPDLTNIVKTQNAPSATSAVNFVQLPGAVTQVVVPAGTTRCVKVLFTAETACGVSPAADLCYVRAMDGAVELDPQGGGFQAIDSEDGSAGGHAFEWVGRLGDGVHNIRIERRVANNATVFTVDDWTFDVEVRL